MHENTTSSSFLATSARLSLDRRVGNERFLAPGMCPRSKSPMARTSKESLAEVARKDDEVVFSCMRKYCPYSAYASAKAVLWGYTHVYRFAGGFPAWQDAGYPTEVCQVQICRVGM